MKTKVKENQKGITLIALVITIIVLLILASVSIAMLTGDNGILTRAGDAKIETAVGAVKEQIGLYQIENKMDNKEVTPENLLAEGKVSRTVQLGEADKYYMYYALKENSFEGMQGLGKGNIASLKDVFLIDDNLNVKYIASNGKEYGDNLNNKVLEDETKIRFSSKAFSKYVSKISGVTEEEMKFKWMKNQTSLTISDSNVDSLRDLVFFPNLKVLNLRQLKIDKLEGIENCKNLKEIYIWYSKLNTLDGLQYCKNLERYDTNQSDIGIYNQIKECTNLKAFVVNEGKYQFEEVIDMLKDKENLVHFIMTGNNIKSIASLRKLINKENMIMLNLSENNIQTIEGMEEYTNLKELYLANNEISDITPLYVNEKINRLDLRGNENIKSNRNEYNQEELKKIDKIGGILDREGTIYLNLDKLELFTNYNILNLKNQKLENLEKIRNMKDLKTLIVPYNKLSLTDINTQEILKSMNKLETLDLSYNPIKDISCLNECTNLKTLNLLGVNDTLDLKQIEDIIPNITLHVNTSTFKTIVNCNIEKITKINCRTSYLTEIPNLSKFTNLQVLNLADNESIVDFNSISNVSNLQRMGLSKNNLHGRMIDFSKLINLTKIDLSNNSLWSEDLENLKALKNNINLTIDLSNNSIIDATALLELNSSTKINLSNNVNLSQDSKDKLKAKFGNNVTF